MPPGDGTGICAIAAAKGRCERKPPPPGGVHDGAVARDQALVAQAESAELVVAMRIDTGLVEYQGWPHTIDQFLHMFS